MGEAIARFRDLVLSIRRVCDERHSQPRGREVEPAAAKKFAKQCRDLLLEHEKAGMPYPAGYVRGLCKRRDEAERHPVPAPPGHFDLPGYIEWLPEPFAAKEPGESVARHARREAVKEALRWGPLFPVVEARIKALDAAANSLLNFAAPECYSWPDEKYWKKVEGGQTVIKEPSKHEADRDYIARHEEFAEALEALAPFIEEPASSEAIAEKKPSSSRRGGRPQTDEDLARDLLDGWRAYEPEEGRKTKDRYLAQRPDVRVLKTEDARQRKIASLGVALDSALHLRREKTKQKKRLRG